MKKRLFSLVLVATMATSMLAGCGDKKETKPTNTTETKVEETETPIVNQDTVGSDETTKEDVNEETKAEETSNEETKTEETKVDENVSYSSGKIIDEDYVVYGKVVIKTVGDESTTYVALNEIDNPVYYSFKSSIPLVGAPYVKKEDSVIINPFGDYFIRAFVLPEKTFTDELPLKELTKEEYYGDPLPEKSNMDFISEGNQTIVVVDKKFDEIDGHVVYIEFDNETTIYSFQIIGDVPDVIYETAKSLRMVTDPALIEEINSIEVIE